MDKLTSELDKCHINRCTKTGINHENATNIYNFIKPIKTYKLSKGKSGICEIYQIDDRKYRRLVKGGLKLYLTNFYHKRERNMEPDECFVRKYNIYILEKKFQKVCGSADEKIQTAPFKMEYYKELYPDFTIKFCYVFNDWFKQTKYLPEMRYLKKYNVSVLWASDIDYYDNLIAWLRD